MIRLTLLALGALTIAACDDTREPAAPSAGGEPLTDAGASSPGAVYAMTNDATTNEIVIFNRAADGRLTPGARVATGGRGSGMVENNANPVILSEQSPNNLNGSAKYLYAVNAGSNSISVFRRTNDGLELTDLEPSGGDHPLSLTVHDNTLYVMNGGTTNCMGGIPSINGFKVTPKGELEPIPGSSRPVAGGSASGCAMISFTPDGGVIVVTERVNDKINTYVVDRGTGLTTGPNVNETTGIGPFGFTYTQRGQLLTTENFAALAFQGGAAAYDVLRDGTVVPLGPTARNGRTDTCWIVNTDNGKFAYVTNFMSGDVSSYAVAPDGTLVLLNPSAATIGFGAADMTFSNNSKFLYVRNEVDGTVHSFVVEQDGSLTPLQIVGGTNTLGQVGIGIAGK